MASALGSAYSGRRVGNIGPATEFTASDSQSPAQPTILTATDDAGAVTGLLKNAYATDDNRPTSGRYC